jgi:hypothetical protein
VLRTCDGTGEDRQQLQDASITHTAAAAAAAATREQQQHCSCWECSTLHSVCMLDL